MYSFIIEYVISFLKGEGCFLYLNKEWMHEYVRQHGSHELSPTILDTLERYRWSFGTLDPLSISNRSAVVIFKYIISQKGNHILQQLSILFSRISLYVFEDVMNYAVQLGYVSSVRILCEGAARRYPHSLDHLREIMITVVRYKRYDIATYICATFPDAYEDALIQAFHFRQYKIAECIFQTTFLKFTYKRLLNYCARSNKQMGIRLLYSTGKIERTEVIPLICVSILEDAHGVCFELLSLYHLSMEELRQISHYSIQNGDRFYHTISFFIDRCKTSNAPERQMGSNIPSNSDCPFSARSNPFGSGKELLGKTAL